VNLNDEKPDAERGVRNEGMGAVRRIRVREGKVEGEVRRPAGIVSRRLRLSPHACDTHPMSWRRYI
jgi:hypothetical protein